MNLSTKENVFEALSFLSPELRAALAASPDGATCGTLPPRQVALLWSDIAGFSRHTQMFLSSGPEGVDGLHAKINDHYDQLIETILSFGGEPVTFVGDGLLSVWPVRDGTMAHAVARAANTARALVDRCDEDPSHFDLNNYVSCGDIQTVELGGRHGRWLTTSVGSALKELAQIADVKDPNQIFLTAKAAALCPVDTVSTPIDSRGACKLLGVIPAIPTDRTVLAVPTVAAWDATVARMPRFARGWIETVGLKYLAELRPVTSVSVMLHGFDHSARGGASALNSIVQIVQDIVHSRDGYVAEVIIDEKGVSILVTFGTPPDAHLDDPLRSVLSAREIFTALKQRNVPSSIGVATGRMMCCIVGNTDRRCDLVLGDALIRSTRLAGTVVSGVFVDQTTMRATRDQVVFDDDPVMMQFKGAQGQSPAWGVADDQSQSMAARNIRGRADEYSTLQQCWMHALAGIYGTNIVIEGESGIGKTSLALQLRRDVLAGGGTFRIVAASAIAQASPFSALRRLVMDVLGVLPLMTTTTRRATILAKLPYELQARAPFLNALFPTGLDETEMTLDLVGQARAAHIQSYVVDLISQALGGNPTCLCIDDAQWLDDESCQVLERLAATVPHLMIVILSQPRTDSSWEGFAQDAGFAHMRLGALSRDGLADLIQQRLDCQVVEHTLLTQLQDLTKGHPFYSAEVLRNLVDEGAITASNGTAKLTRTDALRAAGLPETMHGMVLQRLDRLKPAEQLSLRVASVAGLAFPTGMVCDIHPLADPPMVIAAQLNKQIKNGFLCAQDQNEAPGFAFTHGIVKEVAHSQLPARQSRNLHAKAAQWMEEHATDDRAGHLLELAHHWEQADARDRAVTCMIEEALRLFGQGFAVGAVQVGLRAIRTARVSVPDDVDAMKQTIQDNIAQIERLIDGQHPTALLTDLQPPPDDLALQFMAILSTAPLAFQSNQFDVFAWASTTAMRLVMENNAGPPHAFSMYSIVRAMVTKDKVAGAAWSRAALDLDAATGGHALAAAAFIDTWFHGHWRMPIADSIQVNRAARETDVAPHDRQYASYNIAGGVILSAASGQPLTSVIAQAETALAHPLYRNARMHVHLELQFARALQGNTDNVLSLSDARVDEEKDIRWVVDTEFANQIAFYYATRVRLHRYAGDWEGALDWFARLRPFRAAISGQIAECELVHHVLLARFDSVLDDQSRLPDHAAAIADEIALLEAWGTVQPQNFWAKAEMSKLIWSGIKNQTAAATQLASLAKGLGPEQWCQDRALALEYAARLDSTNQRLQDAVAAYSAWGATAVAKRLSPT